MRQILYFLCLILIFGCDQATDSDQKPCAFAPPESQFPIFPSTDCSDCTLNLQFQGKEYSFNGNQFDAGSDSPIRQSDKKIVYGYFQNSFLSLYLISPSSVESLYNSVNINTPLLPVDTINKLVEHPTPVSAAFGIYDYCNNFFEPITNNVSKSFNQLTRVELIETYQAQINFELYQNSLFSISGHLKAPTMIEGKAEVITVTYEAQIEILEKL